MKVNNGINVSSIDLIFHTRRVYEMNNVSNQLLENLKEKLIETCNFNVGITIKMHAHYCPHFNKHSLISHSFAQIIKNEIENHQYITCESCGNKLLNGLKHDFNLKLIEKYDNLIPKFDYASLSIEEFEALIIKILTLLPSKNIDVFLQTYNNIITSIREKKCEKNILLNTTAQVLSELSSNITKYSLHLLIPGRIKESLDTDAIWDPLIKYFQKKNDPKGVSIIKLNQFASKRHILRIFYLLSLSPSFSPSLSFKIELMKDGIQILKKILSSAREINDDRIFEIVAYLIPRECRTVFKLLTQAKLNYQLLEFCYKYWIPLSHEIEDFENEILACFTYSDIAKMIPYNIEIYGRAIKLIEEGRQIAKTKKLPKMQLMGLMKLAEIYGKYRHPDEIKYRQKSMTLAEELDDKRALIETYYWMGEGYYRLHQYEQALKYLQTFQELFNQSYSLDALKGDLLTIYYIQSFQIVHDIYLKLGFLKKAVEALEKHMNLVKYTTPADLQQNPAVLNYFQNLGHMMKDVKNIAFGKDLTEEFVDGLKESLISSVQHIENFLLPSLPKDTLPYAELLMSAANIRIQLGDYKKAIKNYELALNIQQNYNFGIGVAKCLSEIGRIYFKMKKPKQGIKFLQDALKEEENLTLHKIIDKTLMALYFRRTGKIEQSFKLFEEICISVVKLVESRQFESTREFYGGISSLFIDLFCETALKMTKKKPKEFRNVMIHCLETVESYKNRDIIKNFQKDIEKADYSKNEIIFKKEESASYKLARLEYTRELILERLRTNQINYKKGQHSLEEINIKIEEINYELENIRSEIYLKNISPGQIPKPIEYKVLPATVNSLKNEKKWCILRYLLIPQVDEEIIWSTMLGPEMDLIKEILRSEPFAEYQSYHILIFLIDENDIYIDLNIIDAKEFEAVREQIHNNIKNLENLEKLSNRLYEFLISRRIQKKFEQNNYKYLIIIPDKGLNTIPWEILYDGENYLGLKYALSKNFSLDLFRIAYNQTISKISRKSTVNTVLFGNPTLDLNGAEKEVEKISVILSKFKHNHQPFIREQANHDRFTSTINDAYPILHFAGHGLFLDTDPQLSHLVFDEYNLTAHEISSFSSECLVSILSACETGITPLIEGSEMLGLVRGFQLARIPSVIATNWRVYDDSASNLMTEFYKSFISGKPLAEALQHARKYIYDNYNQDILHWASYTLFGNPFLSLNLNFS